MKLATILPFNSSHVSFVDNLVARLDEHGIDIPGICDIEETVPALDEEPQGLEGFCTAIAASPMREFQTA